MLTKMMNVGDLSTRLAKSEPPEVGKHEKSFMDEVVKCRNPFYED